MNNNILTTEKERLWNGNYIKAMIANFSMFFAFYLLTPLLPVYLSETFHATKDMIGFVLFGYTIAALTVRPFSGYMADSLDRRKVLMACLAVNSLFFAGYLMATSLLLFALVRTIHGAPFGASTVAVNTAVIDVLPSSRRNEGIGYFGLSNNIATAIAPTVGIMIYHYTGNFKILFWMAFAVAVMGMAASTAIRLPQKAVERRCPRRPLDRFFLMRGWLIAVNIIFFGLCYGVLSNYLAIYGKERLGISGGTGTYFMTLAIGLILSRLQGSKSLRKGKLTRNAVEGIALSTIGYTLFVACPNMAGYYASALLIGLGNGHLWPAIQNMIIKTAHHYERGTATSTMLTSWDLGQGIGILTGGVVSEHLGYASAFWGIAVIHVLGMFLFISRTRNFYRKNVISE